MNRRTAPSFPVNDESGIENLQQKATQLSMDPQMPTNQILRFDGTGLGSIWNTVPLLWF